MATGLTTGAGATTAAGWSSDLGGRSDKRRWHYRRSLASRVGLLTTIAVGITVAVLALGAYVTVRMQMQAAIDASLMDRADRAAKTPALSELTRDYQIPSWMLGAADVRMIFITESREWRTFDGGPAHDPRAAGAGRRRRPVRRVDPDHQGR